MIAGVIIMESCTQARLKGGNTGLNRGRIEIKLASPFISAQLLEYQTVGVLLNDEARVRESGGEGNEEEKKGGEIMCDLNFLVSQTQQ